MHALSPFDIAIIGAGGAGIMAAIRAGDFKKNIILIEKNASIGRKILLTGKTRCNITNAADMDTFIEAFGREGRFLRSAFYAFFNRDLIDFFKTKGLMMKTERQGRIFPVTDRATSVVEVLEKCLSDKKNIKLLYNSRLAEVKKENGYFGLHVARKDKIRAKKVIFAMGGASYKATGSSGEGFVFAKKLGHTIVPLKAALVPLKTKETWVKSLAGLSLRNIRIIFKYGNKKISSRVGEIVFTHFGISGPLILDLSGRIVSLLRECREIDLFIDLKPGLNAELLEKRLLREFAGGKGAQLKNAMKKLLPHKLIPVLLQIAGASPDKKVNQASRRERQQIAKLLKALPLTVTGALPIEEAMVTGGGVSTKEINPRTMESKVVPGLYFAGEIIDGAAPSGGYNLQQAFSTGYLAGESASACVK